MGGWIEEAKSANIKTEVASGHLSPLSARARGSIGPCPACGVDVRGSSDKRGPIGVSAAGNSWECHAGGCDAKGDIIDLLSYVMHGSRFRDLGKGKQRSVRDAVFHKGWAVAEGAPAAIPTAKRVVKLHSLAPNRKTRNGAVIPSTSGGPGRGPFAWRDGLPKGAYDALRDRPECRPVLEYLISQRGFSQEVIDRWGLGAMPIKASGKLVELWLTIPLMDQTGTVVNVRFRRVPGPCLYCSPDGVSPGSGCGKCKGSGLVPTKDKYRVCPGRPLPLFGVQHLEDKKSPVVITEGELDVIAMDELSRQGLGLGCVNVVSSTLGGKADWPECWLDLLEPFSHFYIATDDDEVGDGQAMKLAKKLGLWRSSRVTLPEKDAGACLETGVPIAHVKASFDSSEGFQPLKLSTPSEYVDELEDLIANPMKLLGLQTSLPKINSAVGGFLPGLWVVSGETGHGKTTFATWLAWDLTKDTPIGLTSFEQRPIGTVQKLLRMEVGGDFTKVSAASRKRALDTLTNKGVYIVDKYGDVTDHEIIDSMRYARRRYGCRVFLLDHLDFMVRSRPSSESEREAKERVVRTLATIGVEDDIVIFLICHPNNTATAQQTRVQIGHLKGASAIRQDCHGAIVVEKLPPTQQRPFPAWALHFDKVRSEFGKPGSKRILAFGPLSCRCAESWEKTPEGMAGKRIVM